MTLMKPKTGTVEQMDEGSDIFVLESKPVRIRQMKFISMMAGQPVLREILIIETEASPQRILSILLTMLIYVILVQCIHFLFSRYFPKTCKAVTGVVLLALPLFRAAAARDYVFLFLYLVFAATISRVLFRCLRRPMRAETPRQTYRTFKIILRISYFGMLLGLAALFTTFFANLTNMVLVSLQTMFFALYFGLLTREITEFISGHMARNVGYFSQDGMPDKIVTEGVCAICGLQISTDEKILTLRCNHTYHEECIKGWLFLGKKGFCASCRENVDLQGIKQNSWESGENLYSRFVDTLKCLIISLAFLLCIYVFKTK